MSFFQPIRSGITIQNTTPEPEINADVQIQSNTTTGISSVSDSILPVADFNPFAPDFHPEESVSFQDILAQQIRTSVSTLLQRTLTTGSGDDAVQISMGKDGLVHVNVNGKDEWTGTLEQFHRLTIDTGAGNDTVTNNVDGAMINTGSGEDVVLNRASQAMIDTGEGDDDVQSTGDSNSILTGRGDDTVSSEGYRNDIATGSGSDTVESEGDLNIIRTEDGNDEVISDGEENLIATGRGDDEITSSGDSNNISAGEDSDDVDSSGDRNVINLGFGGDLVESHGNENLIIDPEIFIALGRLLNG